MQKCKDALKRVAVLRMQYRNGAKVRMVQGCLLMLWVCTLLPAWMAKRLGLGVYREKCC